MTQTAFCGAARSRVNSSEHSNRGPLERFVFDQEYLDCLTRGDPEVEEHFTRYFGKLLLIKLRGRFKCPQTVADARQETFVRVFANLRKKGTILHPERLGGYVNSVCEHVVLEFYRSGNRTMQMPEDGAEPVDGSSSAESELITAENKQLLKDTLAQSPEEERKLLRAVFWEDRDRDEICKELGIDRNYLRVRVHRALTRFRANFPKSRGLS